MKQMLKKILGQDAWSRITSLFHRIRRSVKRAAQKRNSFRKYVYPVIGKHPRKQDVFLVLSPTYRNLGDHAIAKAEMDLLAQWGIPCREVTIDVIQVLAKYGDYGVFGQSTVFITGGGFLGSLWPHMHEMTCRIITENPKAKIVILPNTLYFDLTAEGDQLFEASLKVFNLPNVRCIYLREKVSYNLVSGKYTAAKLMPDAAMSMNECRAGLKRSGCLICLRNDKEQTLSEAQTAAVFSSAQALFSNSVGTMDMRHRVDIPLDKRMEKLEQKFDQFRYAELVITDRLHGMIFSAITGTPCIVLNSRSHKLAGCYEWIRHLDYIRFCENPEEIPSIYAEIPKREHTYDAAPLAPHFQEMKQELIAIIAE